MGERENRIRHVAHWALLLVAVMIVGLASSAYAATQVWTGGTDTNWSNTLNWNSGAGPVPAAGDIAEFNTSFSLQPTLTASKSVSGLWLADGLGQDVTITDTSPNTLSLGNTPQTVNGNTTALILLDDTANHNLTINGSTAVVNSGTFYVNNTGTLTLTGSLAITASKTLTLGGTNASGNIIISASTTATTGAITVNTAGTVTLSGANLHSGTTTLTAGRLNLNSAGALGTGAMNLNGGTFNNTSGNAVVLTNTGAITWGGDVTFGGTNDLTFGSGALKFGTNRIMTLNRSLTFGGRLEGTDNGANHTATFNGSGYTVTFNGGWAINTGGSTSRNYSIAGDANVLIAGAVINGNGGSSFTYAGTGTLTLAADGSNYTGSATVNNGGTLKIGNGAATGNLPSNVTDSGALIFSHGTNAYTQSTNITGTGSVTQTGAGALTLSGAANSFSGGLTIDTAGGSVIANNASASVLGSGRVSMANSTVINLNGNAPTVGLLRTTGSGSGATIINNTGVTVSAKTLTISAATGTETFAGIIADNNDAGSGTIAVLKNGAGSQTFAGINTYSGGTTLTAGTLALSGSGTLGATTGGLTINGVGTLDLGGTSQTVGAVSVSAGATVQNGTLTGSSYSFTNASGTLATVTASLGGSGGLSKSTAGILAIGNSSTYGGATAISSGTLRLLGTGLPSINSNVALTATANIELTANTTLAIGAGANQVQLAGTTNGFGAFGGDYTLNLGAVTWGGSFAPSTAFQLGTTSSTGKITLTSNLDMNGVARTITTVHGAAADVDAEISGVISGAAGITFNGGGTLYLSGGNNYTGTTSIAAGTVVANSLNSVTGGTSTSSLGAPGAGNGTISLSATANATLRYAGGGETTDRGISMYGGGGSRTSTVDASGTGALVFSSTAGVGYFSTGTGNINTLILSGSSTANNTFSFQIGDPNNGSGGVNVLKSGSGRWIVNNTASYFKRATVISDGSMVLGGDAVNKLAPDQSAIRRGEQAIVSVAGGVFTYTDGSGYDNLVVNDRIVMGSGTAPGSTSNSTAYFVAAIDTVNNTFTISATPGGSVIGASGGTNVGFYQTGVLGSAASAVTLGDATTAANGTPALLVGTGSSGFTTNRPIILSLAAPASATFSVGGNSDAINTVAGLITANRNLAISQVATTGSNALQITGGITGSTAVDTSTTVTFAGPGAINLSGVGISNGLGGGTGTVGTSISGGTIRFNIASSYTGTTTVSGGTLLVNNTTGSGTGSGAVSVTAGTIGGNGTISGTVNVAGTLAPGDGVGRLTIANDLTLAGGATFGAEVNGTTAATDYDQLTISGTHTVDLGGAALSVSMGTFAVTEGQVIYLIDNTGTGGITGTFNGLAEGAQITSLNGVNGFNWDITYVAVNSGSETNDVAIVAVNAVPEPAGLGVIAFGAIGLLRRRNRRTAAC